MKKSLPVLILILLPFTVFMGWRSLTDLQHGNLTAAIGRCEQQSLKYNGVDRVRKFVAALNKIQPGPISSDVRVEFDHYRALWNESLDTYDKTGHFEDNEKDIVSSAKRLQEL